MKRLFKVKTTLLKWKSTAMRDKLTPEEAPNSDSFPGKKTSEPEKLSILDEENYRTVFENTGTATGIVGGDMVISRCNTRFEKLSGYTKKEIEGRMQWSNFVAEDERERISNYYMQRLDGTGNPPPEYDSVFIDKEGNRKQVHVVVAMIPGAKNRIVSIFDITPRKQAETLLRKSEERFRSLVETTSDWIWEVDRNGIYTYNSPKVKDITGYEPEDLLGKPFWSFVAEEEKTYLKQLMENKNASGESFSELECIQIHKNGHDVVIESRGVKIFDEEGNVIGTRGINRDVTEKKKTLKEREDLEQKFSRMKKMEALGLLAGGVAHDLNNILSGVISYPDLLLMDLPKNSELTKPLETIRESGLRAAAVVEDLLIVARGIANPREVVNLNTIIEKYLKSPEYKTLANAHPTVSVKTTLEANLLNAHVSKIHMNKSLKNLVSNAMEAIQGSGEITISTLNRYVDKPVSGYSDVKVGEYVVLSVSDSGGGIAKEDLERIFEPFYTKKIMGRSGTGLGLTIVWNTAQDHKGFIDVISSTGGTTINLFLPTTRNGVSAEKEGMPFDDYAGHGDRILVIDDDAKQREIACGILKKLKYATVAVASGEEAIEHLKTNPVDLVILDMIMPPGLNGRETYERIIEIHPKQRAIIVSGYAETKEVKEAQRLGAGQYVKKPYTLEKIGRAIRQELQK